MALQKWSWPACNGLSVILPYGVCSMLTCKQSMHLNPPMKVHSERIWIEEDKA